MVAAYFVSVAPAIVEVGGFTAVGRQSVVDTVAVHGVADQGSMAVGLSNGVAQSGGGVVMVSLVYVDVAASIIKGSQRIGSEDVVDRSRSGKLHAVQRNAARSGSGNLARPGRTHGKEHGLILQYGSDRDQESSGDVR